MTRGVRSLALAIAAVLVPIASAWADDTAEPATPSEDDRKPRATAGGSIAWVSSDDLDLVGTMHADVPFRIVPGWTGFGSLDMVTAIEKADSDFTFLVRDISYRIELGARRDGGEEDVWSAFVGQVGRQNVDVDGSPWARYVGAGAAASSGHGDTGLAGGLPRWTASSALGFIVRDRDVDADVVVRAGLHHRRPWRGFEVGLDLDLDGLGSFSGAGLQADLRGGGRIGWARARPDGGAARYDLFVHGLRGRNPFGLRIDGVIAGLDIEAPGGFTPSGGSWFEDASVGGSVAAGTGDRDGAGRFLMWVESPRLVGAWRAAITLDANVLTADDTGELYWLYDVGLQRPWRTFVFGGWFYHRSNHTWAEPNPVGVTSINVLEGGIESSGYERLGGEPVVETPWGALDGRVRLGALVDSSFGEDERWHVRLGARWTFPWWFVDSRPYVHIEREDGDVERSLAAIGLKHPSGAGARIEWRQDSQFFGRDDEALLALFEAAF